MKASRTFLLGSGLALALSPWLIAAQQHQDKATPAKIAGKQLVAASELKWAPLPNIPGAEQAQLVGDVTKEAHRAFFKYPVGLKSPLHTHSHGDRGVIVSGTLSLAVEGAAPKQLGPGSFFSLAAGVRHVTAVEGDQPCVFYMEREGPFDVVVVEEAPKK
jgi:quercetin dioxygenase-like cupin family protein